MPGQSPPQVTMPAFVVRGLKWICRRGPALSNESSAPDATEPGSTDTSTRAVSGTKPECASASAPGERSGDSNRQVPSVLIARSSGLKSTASPEFRFALFTLYPQLSPSSKTSVLRDSQPQVVPSTKPARYAAGIATATAS